jgi:hypothetical protein
VIVGSLITWLVTLVYYKNSSVELKVAADDLKKETRILRRDTQNLLRAIKELGLLNLKEKDGQIILSHTLSIQDATCKAHIESPGIGTTKDQTIPQK